MDEERRDSEVERRDSEVEIPNSPKINPPETSNPLKLPSKMMDSSQRWFIIHVILILVGFFSFFIVTIVISLQVILIPQLYPFSIIPLLIYSLFLLVIGIVFQNTRTQKIIFILHIITFITLNLLFENLNYFLFSKVIVWPYFISITFFFISFHFLIFSKSLLGESLHFIFYHSLIISILNIRNHFTDSTTQLIILIVALSIYLLWTIIWILHLMIYRLVVNCLEKKQNPIKEERETEETLMGDPEVEKQRRRARNTKILLEKNAML